MTPNFPSLDLPEGFFSCGVKFGDDGSPGEPCQFAGQCAAGSLCLAPSYFPKGTCDTTDGCCTELCDLDAGDPCPLPGTECLPIYEAGEAPEARLEDAGYCGAP